MRCYYHYHARIISNNTLLGTVDGTFESPTPIKSFDDYIGVKNGIRDNYKRQTGNTSDNINIEIDSFTLIWRDSNE